MGVDWEPDRRQRTIVANVDRDMARTFQRGTGSNILLHDGCDLAMGADRRPTVEATRMLLDRFAQENKRVVTVDAWR